MSTDQTSFGMTHEAENDIKGVFDERFEKYTGKMADIWSFSCTGSCLCSTGDCDTSNCY
ncbi:hypothetical protein [Halorussus litoreus]|uniref:hypothetical protein n=1 Tax=Halorussus litoreus TaxID=1710536 RepID=UPI0018E57160|nr:hypothetical protein [Halorussus litoreus]